MFHPTSEALFYSLSEVKTFKVTAAAFQRDDGPTDLLFFLHNIHTLGIAYSFSLSYCFHQRDSMHFY